VALRSVFLAGAWGWLDSFSLAYRAIADVVPSIRPAFHSYVKPAPHTPAARFGDPFRVGGVTCIKCGYILRGLRMDGRCPECGGAIRDSLEQYRLRHAHPFRLRLVHCGVIGISLWPAVVVGLCMLAGNVTSTSLAQQAMVGIGVWFVLAVLLATVRPARSAEAYPLEQPRQAARTRIAVALASVGAMWLSYQLDSLTLLVAAVVVGVASVLSLGWTLLDYACSISRVCSASVLAAQFSQLAPWYKAFAITSTIASVGFAMGEMASVSDVYLLAILTVPLSLLAIPVGILAGVSGFVLTIMVPVRSLMLAMVLHRAITDAIALRDAPD